MGHVKTWLTGIGLGYAVPNFEAAGIITPQALAELNVAHFEGLGVDNPDDRRKLFFLVQRIKMAAKENALLGGTAATSPLASTSTTTTAAQSFVASGAKQQQQYDVTSITPIQDQVEQVLARASSLLVDDYSPIKSTSIMRTSTSSKNGKVMQGETDKAGAAKRKEEEQDLKHSALSPATSVSSKKASKDETVPSVTVILQEVKEQVKEGEAPAENKVDIAATTKPKDRKADNDAVQVQEMIKSTVTTERSATDDDEQIAADPAAGTTPQQDTTPAVVSTSIGAGINCCGNSTVTISTLGTISTSKTRATSRTRGPPSPESPERNKNNNNKAIARRKLSKLAAPPVRGRAVSSGSMTTAAMTISDRSASQTAASQQPQNAPSSLTMIKPNNAAGNDAKERHDEHDHYEEEKKQETSVMEDDISVEMTLKDFKIGNNQSISAPSVGAAGTAGTNNSQLASRRMSKRLIEKQREAQKKQERGRPAATTKSNISRMQTSTTKIKASAAPITTPKKSSGTISNSKKPTGTIRRTCSEGTLLHRQSGVPAPKSRRAAAAPCSSNVPKSARTGKELSSIPSNSIAPMSPLITLTDQGDNARLMPVPPKKQQQPQQPQRGRSLGVGRRTATASRRTLTDSESEDSNSIGLHKNRRQSHSVEPRHYQYRQQSCSTSDSSGSPQKRPSYRRRHSERIVNNRPRAGSHASMSSDDAIDTSVLELRGTVDMSFQSQIAALRDENEQEHDLFGKVDKIMDLTAGTGNDEEDLMRIRVVVRKRPMSRFEVTNAGNIDVIQPLDYGDYGRILTYQPKTRVDLTKEIETIPFAFDNVFDDTASNVQIYERAVRNLIPPFFDGQWASIFAYGQTGSGKTFTMMGSNLTTNGATETENLGLYYLAALDIFQALKTEGFQDYSIGVSLFEIYGGKLYDLLNDRTVVKCLEDSHGKVCFPGLTEHDVGSPDALMGLIEKGACRRSTGTTSRNADSSRSHAVLQLHLRTLAGSGFRRKLVEHSRLSFIDLAGNERGADTYCADRATRMEGAEINTSLLALKEVIRALATGGSMTHVPFRGSKLTQVLKESFVGNNCRSIMIACISPNIGNCEQTLNTLRYANRVKERNPQTGELSIVWDGTNSSGRRPSSSTRSTALSSSFQWSDSLCGDGLSSVLDEQQQQQHSSSDREQQSEGGNTTDILDELLGSPSPAVTDSEGPGPIDLTNTSSSNLMPLHHRHVVQKLLTVHEATIPVLLNMLQDEMSLVSETEGHGGIEQYTAQLDVIHENQLELFAKLRNRIQAYRDARQEECPNPEILSDDGSFEDLRD